MTSRILESIFSKPTAPFREGFVLSEIARFLKSNRIPFHFDKAGNLIAGWNGKAATRKKIRIGFMAHTDHPGFHVRKQIAPLLLEAFWLGGAPYKKLKNSTVRVHDPKNLSWSARGKIVEVGEYNPRHGTEIKILLDRKEKIPRNAYGAFDYPGFKRQGNRIITRAADDLAGCVIQLCALMDTYHHFPGRAVAVFTRAEEIGYVGCLAAIKNKSLPHVPFVSLEASKELEGARIGRGPVLRLGDYESLFDTSLSQALLKEARKLQKNKHFQFQRRIMDGGTCEATALNVLGFRASGISVPLGNYHNQRPDGKPGPEIISLSDVENARLLCSQLIQNFEPDLWSDRMKQSFKQILKHNQKLLRFKTESAD